MFKPEDGERLEAGSREWTQPLLARLFAWANGSLRLSRADWQARRPALVRATAHLSMVFLAVTVVVLGRIQPPTSALGSPSSDGGFSQPPPTATGRQAQAWRAAPPLLLARMAVPHTTIPERPRTTVITYTVQSGDTVFGIAEMFGLTGYTIYWANSDVLQDNPHMLWPDMVLNILPVNGVYHTVAEGETIDSIAEKYNVDVGVILNEWNHLEEGQSLQAGTSLVIPGGTREFVVWQLPKYNSLQGSAASGVGVCQMPSVGLRGYGWFNWPTDSRRISGWVFHDPRNPPHCGIDIGLRTGDPLYATDNGVIAYAGWNDYGYGYLIVIDHGNGFQTYYGHLSAIWVVCGQSVYQGAAIGAGGSTGRSSGPHLHLEIRYEGVPQDPAAYLP
jgi:LysM repeat protein